MRGVWKDCRGKATVQRTLNDLVKDGKIIKIGGGRYTKYKWNWEDEA